DASDIQEIGWVLAIESISPQSPPSLPVGSIRSVLVARPVHVILRLWNPRLTRKHRASGQVGLRVAAKLRRITAWLGSRFPHEVVGHRTDPVRAVLRDRLTRPAADPPNLDVGGPFPRLRRLPILVELSHNPCPNRYRKTTSGGSSRNRLRLVEADPHTRQNLRGVADEPDVGRIVRGARLPRRGDLVRQVADRGVPDAISGTPVDHLPQHVRDDPGDGGGEGDLRSLSRLPDDPAAAVLDSLDVPRLDAEPAVCERGVAGDEIDRVNGRRADEDRRVGRDFRLDPCSARDVLNRLHADLLTQPDRHHVLRALQRFPQRHLALVVVGVVAGDPGVAVRHPDEERGVREGVEGRAALLERRGEDERLERGARLPERLRRAVELRLAEVTPAHECEDGSGVWIEAYDRPLEIGSRYGALSLARLELLAELLVRGIAEIAVGTVFDLLELRFQRRFGLGLKLGVERGVDPEPAGVEQFAEARLQVTPDLLDE